MVFRRPWSSTGFRALQRVATRRRGVVFSLAALPIAACGLFLAGAASPVSLSQASCAPADFADAKFVGGFLCGLAAAVLGSCFFRLRRSIVAKQFQSAMTSRMATQDQVARQFQDDLIQGVQGLIITLQLVAQDNPTARTAIEDALNRAEAFLIQSRDRLQALQDVGAGDQGS
jgi:hypothetical protein